MADVFISYGNPEDKNTFPEGKQIADGLKEVLLHHARNQGLKEADMLVFVAPGSIPLGKDSGYSILQNIRDCKWFLFVANKDSSNSPYAQQELGAAVALGKTVYPILASSANPEEHLHGFIKVWQAAPYEDANTIVLMIDQIVQGKKKMLQRQKPSTSENPLARELEKILHKSQLPPPDDNLSALIRTFLGNPPQQ